MDLSAVGSRRGVSSDDEDIMLLKNSQRLTLRCPRCTRTRWLCSGVTVVIGILVAVLASLASGNQSEAEMSGWEALFVAGVSPDRIDQSLKALTSAAHMAGTPQNSQLAALIGRKFREAGLTVSTESHRVLLSYPAHRELSITSPASDVWTAPLRELPCAEDEASGLPHMPTFLAYSGSGTHTAPLVYANYGRSEDFAALKAHGVSIAGKIVIVRYGKVYRGNKVDEAERAGALGCIIYSDPADDGFARGPVYPAGPWRPESGVQRGSVWLGNGDPLTPGYPATARAPRISLAEARSRNGSAGTNIYGTPLPAIPALPISWGDAYRLLKGLGANPVPGSAWQGGLNFTYKLGPGPVEVRLSVLMNETLTRISNVIGKLQGHSEPDRAVLLGNHRDAWAFGAGDASSGTAALLEVAHGLAALSRTGWRPRRSIWLCSWDAEEFALTGSTEFVELHFKSLFQQAVAYLNVDMAVSGSPVLELSGVPSLTEAMAGVAALVPAPSLTIGGGGGEAQTLGGARPIWSGSWSGSSLGAGPGRSLLDLWRESAGTSTPVLDASAMGTGSDYGAFLHHAGIPSVNLAFTSKTGIYAGVYHSIYDSYRWMSRFGDPGFAYHGALTALWGALALRLADRPLLPLAFSDYGPLLARAVNRLQAQTRQVRGPSESVFPSDPNTNSGSELDPANPVDFASLKDAVRRFTAAGDALARVTHDPARVARLVADPLALRRANDRLHLAERALLFLQGVRGREWYRHLVWVNSVHDGYSSDAFGTVGDAVAVGDWKEAQRQADLVAVVLEQAAEFMESGGGEA